MPAIYLPHGGGPCFFMEWTMGPRDTWEKTRAWLESLGRRFAHARALLVVSAHWEEAEVTVQTTPRPALVYDYGGFPAHTYELSWPAPGAPQVADRALALLREAGIDAREEAARGYDHGVFVPLKVAFPEAEIPCLQLSLRADLDPAHHLRAGRALAPLRNEGVLILGSGMSFHNMRAFGGGGRGLAASREFDAWLEERCTRVGAERRGALTAWTEGPQARFSHPREEHLLPLMVAAGAAEEDTGRVVFRDEVMGVVVSAIEFGGSG